MHQQYKLTL